MKPVPMLELIERAKAKHNMDYSMVDIKAGKDDDITIICPIHGNIHTTMSKHLGSKLGCIFCYKDTILDSLEKFEKKSRKIHGNKYKYLSFTKPSEACLIDCPIHGTFEIIANYHLGGRGCPKCIKNEKKDKILQRFKIISSDFDYSKVKYVNIDTKVILLDKNGWDYVVSPYNYFKKGIKAVQPSEETKLKVIHKELTEKYPLYSFNVVSTKIVEVICPVHGVFKKPLKTSWKKGPCIKCNPVNSKYNTSFFIEESKKLFPNEYSYSCTICNGCYDEVIVTCPIHGDFTQKAYSHLSGHGCPVCSSESRESIKSSKAEKEILRIIPESIQGCRELIFPLELDIYSKKYKFAIEYNGILWHSEGNSFPIKEKLKKYHLNKTELCEGKGIQLYHIFENEWINPIKKNIWKSMIISKLGKSERIYARKCIVKEISLDVSKQFLEINHMQGYLASKIKIGLFHNDELVQVMTFSKPRFNKSYQYELIRLCSKTGITVIGGASKLLKYFERKYNPESIISYANRRWSQGNVYEKLGFEFSHKTEPNYFYFKGNTLESRNKYQKHKLKKLLPIFNSELTEKENMFNNEYRRIYDCGNLVYIKINKG